MKRKYKNKKTKGYDSKKEAKRALELQILEKATFFGLELMKTLLGYTKD